ncbi:MAG: hypothetical protein R2862_12865 [Thermoanaerobaculia bacterium]
MSYTTVHAAHPDLEKGYIALEQDRGNNYYAPAVDRATIVPPRRRGTSSTTSSPAKPEPRDPRARSWRGGRPPRPRGRKSG